MLMVIVLVLLPLGVIAGGVVNGVFVGGDGDVVVVVVVAAVAPVAAVDVVAVAAVFVVVAVVSGGDVAAQGMPL